MWVIVLEPKEKTAIRRLETELVEKPHHKTTPKNRRERGT